MSEQTKAFLLEGQLTRIEHRQLHKEIQLERRKLRAYAALDQRLQLLQKHHTMFDETDVTTDLIGDASIEDLQQEADTGFAATVKKIWGKFKDKLTKIKYNISKDSVKGAALLTKAKAIYENPDRMSEEKLQSKKVKLLPLAAHTEQLAVAKKLLIFLKAICHYNGIDTGHREKQLALIKKLYADLGDAYVQKGSDTDTVGWEVIWGGTNSGGKQQAIKPEVGTPSELGYTTLDKISTMGKQLLAFTENVAPSIQEAESILLNAYKHYTSCDNKEEMYYWAFTQNQALYALLVANEIVHRVVSNYLLLIDSVEA